MKQLRFVLPAVAVMLMAMPMQAQGTKGQGNKIHVSQHTGSNRNDGSRENPVKNIQRAIEMASSGDVIYVAEGNYYGLLGSGNIKIDKGISILGGYSSDFS